MEIHFKECPLCYSKRIVRKTGTVTRRRNGQEVRIPHVRYTACLACGEHFYSSDAMRRMEEYLARRPVAA